MKSKYFILTMMAALLCVLGSACDDGQTQNSGSGNSGNSGDSGAITPPATEEPAAPEQSAAVITINQSAVTFCVGETFTLVAQAENIPNAAFSWSIDGDAASDVVSLSQIDNTAVITALKTGKTKLVASVTYEDKTYFKTVDVTVNEPDLVNLVVSNNIGFNNDGYHVQLSTLSAGGATSVTPTVSVYKDNKLQSGITFSWRSENESVAALVGNKIEARGEGSTLVIGTCQIDEKEYVVRIAVDVSRPTISLSERFVIERENLSTLSISSTLNGTVTDVLYNGKSVGTYDAQKKTVTLEKDKLPTYAAELGEGKQLIIQTTAADYAISVDMYTKILYTKADLDNLGQLSKQACSSNAAIWDGYFVLGDDIAYNGVHKSKVADLDSLWSAVEGNWSNGGLYGFRGVFDGKGHNIQGISIDNGAQIGSIFGVLHVEGVVKNVSFTNASVAANSSLVCGAGGGTVENVYVQYDSVGVGAQHYEGDGVTINTYCATFFGFKEPTITANVSNCVVDVTNATFNTATSIKLIGSEFASIKNVFLIGGSKELQKASNATMSFDAYIDFVKDKAAQNRYASFNEEFWSHVKGVPVSQTVYEQVCAQVAEDGVEFQNSATCLVSGTSYKFPVNNRFVEIKSDNVNVTIQSGIATVAQTVTAGESVNITAAFIFDESICETLLCTLAFVEGEVQDLTIGENKEKTAYYDLTLGEVKFADLASQVKGDVLYYLNADYTMATFGKDGDAAKAFIAVTADKLYKFNCISVTKVIENATDLHYLRKDYTVSSYGNDGCYDGKILGTYVLLNDIDCTGLTLDNSGKYWENSRGFAGTLDGRGYTISNLSVGQNGFFGALAHATIKNINFTDVRLVGKVDKDGNVDGSYVALFAPRVFNTTVENVKIQFVEYAAGASVYATSGLMFYETSFDNVFKNITLDISTLENVIYLTECYYDADIPYLSKGKSVYENITVIVADLNEERPVFAYKQAKGAPDDVEEYPENGFNFIEPEQVED